MLSIQLENLPGSEVQLWHTKVWIPLKLLRTELTRTPSLSSLVAGALSKPVALPGRSAMKKNWFGCTH